MVGCDSFFLVQSQIFGFYQDFTIFKWSRSTWEWNGTRAGSLSWIRRANYFGQALRSVSPEIHCNSSPLLNGSENWVEQSWWIMWTSEQCAGFDYGWCTSILNASQIYPKSCFTFGTRWMGRTYNIRLVISFLSVSAEARQPRYQKLWNRFSSHKDTTIWKWWNLGKILKSWLCIKKILPQPTIHYH